MSIVRAYIGGDRHDLDYLFEHLPAGGISVERDNVGYLVLRHEGRREAVQKQLEELAAILSGMCCLHLDSRTPLRINHYVEIGDDGNQMIYIADEEEAHMRDVIDVEVTSEDGVATFASPGSQFADTLRLATADASVGKVMALLADADLSWVNLYRIYETIRGDLGGEKELVSRGWCSKKTISLFGQTANSFTAIGKQSRHAAESTEPPRQPMTYGEAKALIFLLAHEWLGEKKAASA
jgi:hypothetical protein